MKSILSLIFFALTGCATVPMSSLDYDWYYSSEIGESFDKFEGIGTISINSVDIATSTDGLGQPYNPAKISFHYHYKEMSPPSFGFFTITRDSSVPQLESADFKFESNGQFHQGRLVNYKKYPRQVGSAAIGSYSGSYSESTRFVEVAQYKFEINALCPFNRLWVLPRLHGRF